MSVPEDSVESTFVPTAAPGCATLETVAGLVVITRQGTTVHLNQSAALLWQFFDGQASVGELAEDVAAVFELPPGQALAEVTAIVTDLMVREVLERPDASGDGEAAPGRARRADGGWLLRPKPCKPCGDDLNAEVWAATVALEVGDYHLGVRCESDLLADVVREMLADHLVDDPEVPADFSLTFTPGEGAEAPRVDLYRDHSHLWRSPSSDVVARVLLCQLARYAGTPALWWVSAVAAVGPAGAQLLPPELGSMLGFLGPRLSAAGCSLVNAPLAIDPVAGEVVADPVGLSVDPGGRAAFAQISDWVDDKAAPAQGRHRLVGWPMSLPDADADLDPSVLSGTPAVVASMLGSTVNPDDWEMTEAVAHAVELAARVDTAMPPTEGDVGDWLVQRLGGR